MDLTTYALLKKYVKASLEDVDMLQGKSAYEIAVENGFEGSVSEWLDQLTGEPGVTPHIGNNGHWFIDDVDTGVPASGGVSNFDDLLNKPTVNNQPIQGGFNIIKSSNSINIDEDGTLSVSDAYTNDVLSSVNGAADRASQSAIVAGNYAAEAIQAKNAINKKIWYGTMEEYNALESVSRSTIYIILHE